MSTERRIGHPLQGLPAAMDRADCSLFTSRRRGPGEVALVDAVRCESGDHLFALGDLILDLMAAWFQQGVPARWARAQSRQLWLPDQLREQISSAMD